MAAGADIAGLGAENAALHEQVMALTGDDSALDQADALGRGVEWARRTGRRSRRV